MRTILLAVFAGALTALSGCAGLPEREAAAFSVLASSSQVAFEGAAVAEENAVREVIATGAVSGQNKLLEAKDCTLAIGDAKKECFLTFTLAGKPRAYKTTAQNMRALASVLAQYGKAMEELAKAEDVGAVQAATGEAAASVKALANLIPEAGPAVGAIIDLAVWMRKLQLVEERRENLLKLAEEADVYIPFIAKRMAMIADTYRTHITAAEHERLTYANMDVYGKKGSEKDRRAHVDTMFESVKRINAANKIPTDFSPLVMGHTALLSALRDPEVDASVAVGQLREFVERLKAIEAAFKK